MAVLLDYSRLVAEHGSVKAACGATGIRPDNFRRGMARQIAAAERGELGYSPVIPGFAIKEVSSKQDGQWVKQRRAPGEAFEVPDGLSVKGVSALVDGEGRTVQKWVLAREGAKDPLALAGRLRAAFDDFKPHYMPPIAPAAVRADLLTKYVLGDHHLGLLAWKPESGEHYDLKIGEKLLNEKMDELVLLTPPAATAIFENLGDFFHSNNARNRTDQSDNALDVDGRYGKVLEVGIRLAVSCVLKLLRKHDRVVVAWLRGNHDPEVALAAMLALKAWFRDEPRVVLEFNPSKFFAFEFGRVALFATHGDTVKPQELVGFLAAKFPEMWGRTTKRYCDLGHVHHSAKGGEAHGLVWESFQTLAAKDAWHAGEGYLSDRSMTAITYHRVSGEHSRNRVSVN